MVLGFSWRIVLCAIMLMLPLAQQPDPHDLAYCINHAEDPSHPPTPPHACACHQPCDPTDPQFVHGDPACATYCHRDHCHCRTGCGES